MIESKLINSFEVLNPTQEQEQEMYQNIMKEVEANGDTGNHFKSINAKQHRKKVAAILLFVVVLVPSGVYAMYQSDFLNGFFRFRDDFVMWDEVSKKDVEAVLSRREQAEDYLLSYMVEDGRSISYGGYEFTLSRYIVNNQYREAMIQIDVKKNSDTVYEVVYLPRNEKDSETGLEGSFGYTEDGVTKYDLSPVFYENKNLSEMLQMVIMQEDDLDAILRAKWVADNHWQFFYIVSDLDYYGTEEPNSKPFTFALLDGNGEVKEEIVLNDTPDYDCLCYESEDGKDHVLISPYFIKATSPTKDIEGASVEVCYENSSKNITIECDSSSSAQDGLIKSLYRKPADIIDVEAITLIRFKTRLSSWEIKRDEMISN